MWWMYVLAILRVHFTVLTIDLPLSMMALFSCSFRVPAYEPEKRFIPDDEKWGKLKFFIITIVLIYIAWQIFYVMWRALSIPVFEWDVIWRIGLKARIFFFDHTIEHLKDLPYPGYALGGPFILCWSSLQTGRWCEEALRSIPAFEYLMFIVFFFGSLNAFVSRFWAILGVGLLVSSGFFTYHATLLYSDLSVSILFCSSIFCLLLWDKSNDNRLLPISSLLLGAAGLFKLESFIFAFLVILTWGPVFISKKCGLRALMSFLVPVTLILICHETLIGNLHVSADGIKIGLLGLTGMTGRMLMTLIALAQQFFVSWNWNVLGGLLSALLIAHLKSIWEHEVNRRLFIFFCLWIIYLFMASVLTDKFRVLAGPDSYQTLPRMILQFYPLCPALIVLILAKV